MIHGVKHLGPKTQMMKNTVFKYYKFEEVKTEVTKYFLYYTYGRTQLYFYLVVQ